MAVLVERRAVALLAELGDDADARALGQVLEPLRELDRAVLVRVELREERVDEHRVGWDVEVSSHRLVCEWYVCAIDGTQRAPRPEGGRITKCAQQRRLSHRDETTDASIESRRRARGGSTNARRGRTADHREVDGHEGACKNER